MMHPRRFVWFWLVLSALLIALLALAMLASPAAAQPGDPGDVPAIETLVAAMRDAILAQDRATYLEYVDLSNPLFRREHTYWIADWATGAALDRFKLQVDYIRVTGDTATGTLTLLWAHAPDVSYRQAEFPALFVRDAEGQWRFAGGAWETLTTEHFLIHVFPGMEPVAEAVIAMLPEIYDHATGSLDYVPDTVMHIKLYDHPDDIAALTALSLPPFSGWNEPGEALKMLVLPGETPSAAVLAHELAHFLTFEMAGTTRGNYPWWLTEGISEYVASEYWPEPYRVQRMNTVALWAATDRLAPWDAIADFEETPHELWRYVYPQSYAFVRFVTEEYGSAARNAWITALARDMDLDAATQATFDLPFDALDTAFKTWLETSY